MKLRVGLVGLGDAWQQRHAPALRALADRFEVRAVCEQVGHRAEQAAAEFSAAAVDGYRALARREDIDAVLILSPQWYGALPILAACESGKAVYCAAGLDLEPADAELVRQRVEQTGIAFVAEFPRRQAPATLRLKKLIATRLGDPRLLFCHQRVAAKDRDHALSGCPAQHSALRDLIELVDWCRYVVDREASYVTGVMHEAGNGLAEEDYQMMSLDFSDRGCPGTGTIAQISCGYYFPAGWHEAITYRPVAALQVSCEHGVAFVDLPSTLVWFDEAGRHQESLDSERPVGEQLLGQFHRAVTSLLRKTRGLEDTYRALFIVQQARESHMHGRRIEL
ncbi:MAG: Gfo/Idh/MocA family oxidoreductase [Pirellulales bacterium]|nr:Gfo/Idh/MocA family oxidoreductase [Pirellulales bacterium]